MMHAQTIRRKLQIAAMHETKTTYLRKFFSTKTTGLIYLTLPIAKIQGGEHTKIKIYTYLKDLSFYKT